MKPKLYTFFETVSRHSEVPAAQKKLIDYLQGLGVPVWTPELCVTYHPESRLFVLSLQAFAKTKEIT